METGNGCAERIVMIITALITAFGGYFSAFAPADTRSSEEDYPFVLAEEGVEYSFRETLNCQYVIAGNVEFLDASDHENLGIMAQPLATYDDRRPATVFIGNDTEFGEHGWSQLLVGNYWYLVWIQDLTLEAPLSEEILVDQLDCGNGRTLAVVNFRQVLPLN